MPWSDLINQNRVVDALRRTLDSGRVAHAYLFHGPEGVGKTATAIAFAQALQCERGGNDACGKCIQCTKIARFLHPDVRVLLPQPKDVVTDEIPARLQLLASNPFSVVDFSRRPSLTDPTKVSNKQVYYHVERVREDLHGQMNYRPTEGRYSIAILTDAHLMRTEAANAFLKLLEEPAATTVFILIAPMIDRLLPTIISRCQPLRFDLLEADHIEKALIDREQISPDRASMLARMAGGSYARALELADGEDLHEHREMIVRFMRYSYARNIREVSSVISQMSGLSRERVKNLMPLMETWVRDLVLYRTMGDRADLINVDQHEVISRFCDNLPHARLDHMVSLVEEAHMLIERNVNLNLLLTTLSSQLAAAMRGEDAARLYIPLNESLRGAA